LDEGVDRRRRSAAGGTDPEILESFMPTRAPAGAGGVVGHGRVDVDVASEGPPLVRAYDGWESLYAAAAEGLAVLATVEEAVAWANDLITRAEQAGHRSG
jgi:hypothetical protein